jgi:hypothetical protein
MDKKSRLEVCMTIAVAVTCKPLEFMRQPLMKRAPQVGILTEECPYPSQYSEDQGAAAVNKKPSGKKFIEKLGYMWTK